MFRDKHFWIGACFVVALAVTMALLVGCGMTDDEVRAEKAACKTKGGHPVVMQRLVGGEIVEVRCL